MKLQQWLRDTVAQLFGRRPATFVHKKNSYRPRVEALEDRRLMAFDLGQLLAGAPTANTQVVVADFDADGNDDVAFSQEASIQIYRGLGDGTFTATAAASIGIGSGDQGAGLVAGDFNRDGKIDLAVVDRSDEEILIFRNTSPDGGGTISFTSSQTIAVPSDPFGLVAGDFDNDGYLDLGVLRDDSEFLRIYRNNNGSFVTTTFATAIDLGASGDDRRDIVTGDFNNDGKLDIAVSQNEVLTILRNNSTGTNSYTFTPFNFTVGSNTNSDPRGLGVGDFDKDGDLDIAVVRTGNETVRIMTNNSAGSTISFAQGQRIDGLGDDPRFDAVGDYNKDGKLDLAVSLRGGTDSVAILLGNGSGSFSLDSTISVGNGPNRIASGDFNNDGMTDLALAVLLTSSNPVSPGVRILLNDYNCDCIGWFEVNKEITVGSSGSNPRVVATGDIDGDGKLDLVVSNSSGDTVVVLFGDGAGNFTSAVTLTVGSGNNPQGVALGDFNLDGKLDIAATRQDSDDVVIFRNLGGRSFAARVTFDMVGDTDPEIIAVGDFNKDGRLDIVVANNGVNAGNVNVMFNTTTRYSSTLSFTVVSYAAGGGSTEPNPTSVAVGDFNKDGNLDFAITDEDSGTNRVRIFLGNGTTTAGAFQTQNVTLPAGASAEDIVVGDLNDDGILDFVVSAPGTDSVYVLLSNDQFVGSTLDAGDFDLFTLDATDPRRLALGDADCDGDLDIFVANFDGNVGLFLNDGSGSFGSMDAFQVSVGSTIAQIEGITVGDFNCDGCLDVAATVANQGKVVIMFGQEKAATSLSYITQPPATIQAGAFLPPILVQIVDQRGNAFAQAGTQVNITIPGLGALLFTATTDANGLATFSEATGNGIKINLANSPGQHYNLLAEAAGLDDALSNDFVVNPATTTSGRRSR